MGGQGGACGWDGWATHGCSYGSAATHARRRGRIGSLAWPKPSGTYTNNTHLGLQRFGAVATVAAWRPRPVSHVRVSASASARSVAATGSGGAVAACCARLRRRHRRVRRTGGGRSSLWLPHFSRHAILRERLRRRGGRGDDVHWLMGGGDRCTGRGARGAGERKGGGRVSGERGAVGGYRREQWHEMVPQPISPAHKKTIIQAARWSGAPHLLWLRGCARARARGRRPPARTRLTL